MMQKSVDNLKTAFAGESQAHMKYQAFADRAEKDGMPNIGRLFRAVSFAEKAHATSHLRIIGGIGSTGDNLGSAIQGEDYEIEKMYPAFQMEASAEGDKRAVQSIVWALEAEKIHRELYKKAKLAADGGKDIEATPIFVCEVCGHTAEREAPDKCPLCGAKKEKFRKF